MCIWKRSHRTSRFLQSLLKRRLASRSLIRSLIEALKSPSSSFERYRTEAFRWFSLEIMHPSDSSLWHSFTQIVDAQRWIYQAERLAEGLSSPSCFLVLF
eukprot:m.352993 g.352993  ORF g.352993 m.352993 type:complete len:100 (+) comp55918_c0_seq14:751-1050(+)